MPVFTLNQEFHPSLSKYIFHKYTKLLYVFKSFWCNYP